jgi:RNA recognition motif-containing protein
LFFLARMAGEEHEFNIPKSNKERPTEHKNKKKRLLDEKEEVFKERSPVDVNPKSNDASTIKERKKKQRRLLVESRKVEDAQEVNRESPHEEEEQEVDRIGVAVDGNLELNGEIADIRKNKRKNKLLKEAAEADKRGICYLSQIPPHMDPLKLRQILSQYGEIQRIYLTPKSKQSVEFFRWFVFVCFLFSGNAFFIHV